MKVQEITVKDQQAIKKLIKRKKRMKIIRRIVFTVLLFVTLVLLALSPLFNIIKIEIQGSKHYKESDIISATDIMTGNNGFKTLGKSIQNILTLRYRNAEKDILKNHPYIKEVRVNYILPGKISILIREREPFAVVPYLGANLLIDKEGYVFDTLSDVKQLKIPLLIGLDFERYEIGQALKTKNSKGLNLANTLMDTIQKKDEDQKFKLMKLIKSVDITDPVNIYFIVDSRIKVNFGELDNLDYRIDALRQIYTTGLKKEDRGLLDFTTGKYPGLRPEK